MDDGNILFKKLHRREIELEIRGDEAKNGKMPRQAGNNVKQG